MRRNDQSIALLTLLACSACGGNVNLGNREPPSVPAFDEPAAASGDDPYLVKSEHTLELTEFHATGAIVVAGKFLYIAGFQGGQSGLFRCTKANCQSTFGRLPGVSENLTSLQVYSGRLGVLSIESNRWLGSFALPDASDRQEVLEKLPLFENIAPLFYAGFVYWPMNQDSAYYRCALPTCAGGPRKLFEPSYPAPASSDGSLIFTVSDGQIVRMTQLGDGPIDYLLPDTHLSLGPRWTTDRVPEQASEYALHVTTGAGMLYAAIGSFSCIPDCPSLIARWPANGGPREELFRTETEVLELVAFDRELVWLAARLQDPGPGELATCRVEACARTLRHLGPGPFDARGIAADEDRIYWLEDQRVRSVKRLPQP